MAPPSCDCLLLRGFLPRHGWFVSSTIPRGQDHRPAFPDEETTASTGALTCRGPPGRGSQAGYAQAPLRGGTCTCVCPPSSHLEELLRNREWTLSSSIPSQNRSWGHRVLGRRLSPAHRPTGARLQSPRLGTHTPGQPGPAAEGQPMSSAQSHTSLTGPP